MDNLSDSRFEIIPVDPHRIFALWSIVPDLLRRAEDAVGVPRPEAGWFLRAFRLADPGHGLHQALSVDDFPITPETGQSYCAFGFPGGFVVAVIGAKDRHGRFFPLLNAPCVALPEAPESDAFQEALPAAVEEKAVPGAVEMDALPEELRRPSETGVADPAPADPHPITGLPETPALDEERIVAAALNGMALAIERQRNESNASSRHPEHAPKSPNPTRGASLSSDRLASHYEEEQSGAPLALRGTLVLEGIVQPGQRLLIEGADVVRRPDGRFTWKRSLEDFPLLWSVLSELPPGLITEPVEGSPFSGFLLSALVDIEGVVREPDYVSRLPEGIHPDASGRFRMIRAVSPDTPFFPRIEAVPSPV